MLLPLNSKPKYCKFLKDKLSATPKVSQFLDLNQLLKVAKLDVPIMETPIKDMIESYVEYLNFPVYSETEYKIDSGYGIGEDPYSRELRNEYSRYLYKKSYWTKTKLYVQLNPNPFPFFYSDEKLTDIRIVSEHFELRKVSDLLYGYNSHYVLSPCFDMSLFYYPGRWDRQYTKLSEWERKKRFFTY